MWSMNFIYLYKNRAMKPAEIVLRENDGGGKSNQGTL
jgi:hypothetical protein